jgi:hypothetical protein
MISAKFNSDEFLKDMNQIVEYSTGFIEGAQRGKVELLENIGKTIVDAIKQFIDSNARVSPQALHHVYEWYRTGSPESRLFDINYVATHVGLSFSSTFRQSVSVKMGSKVPFYDKAEIMERGVPVTIVPSSRKPLVFESGGEMVFTKSPVTVSNPGGDAVEGSYQKIFNEFFEKYFSQSFLRSSGILNHLNDPTPFKSNLSGAKQGGKSFGINVGYRWITRSKGGVVV